MLHFTSRLSQAYKGELERLMFFNAGQKNVHATIEQAVEKYGSPNISVADGALKITMDNLKDSQALFTLTDKKLIAVMVYSRLSVEAITVIHIAIDEEYSANGRYSSKMVMLRQLNMLRQNARRIRGVKIINLKLGENRVADFSLPLNKPSHPKA
ncbi:MAG: hypothetical protein KTR17_05520 [Cellvibrionaceae bacterium]|nr:hypothetical protein [Cellvibrionaceae bacterium]